jgi:hypothetical protein
MRMGDGDEFEADLAGNAAPVTLYTERSDAPPSTRAVVMPCTVRLLLVCPSADGFRSWRMTG